MAIVTYGVQPATSDTRCLAVLSTCQRLCGGERRQSTFAKIWTSTGLLTKATGAKQAGSTCLPLLLPQGRRLPTPGVQSIAFKPSPVMIESVCCDQLPEADSRA